jgi:hypothetical protein
MEQGRWHDETQHFRSRPKPRHAPSRVRRKAREVEALYAATPSQAGVSILGSAQSDVWREISDVSADLGVRSSTGAMDEVYDHHSESLDEWIAHFPRAEGQVGLLAFLGRRPLGLDVVGSAGLYTRLHERFLGGYCIDGMTRGGRGRKGRGEDHAGAPTARAAERFLADVGSAKRGQAPTVGKGTYRLLSGASIGAELSDVAADRQRLVHLSAFPSNGSAAGRTSGHNSAAQGPAQDPIASPIRRRGWARDRDVDAS